MMPGSAVETFVRSNLGKHLCNILLNLILWAYASLCNHLDNHWNDGMFKHKLVSYVT